MPTLPTSAAPRRARWRTVRALVIAALAMAAAACSKPASQDAPSDPPAGATTTATATANAGGGDAVAKAKELFNMRCVPCHGAAGKGDGPASPSLQPPPRNLADPAWQKSVEDTYIVTIIKSGGAAVGKSPAMPSNPDLNDPAVLTALKDHVRSLGATN